MNNENKGWKFEKSISIGHVLTAVPFLIMTLWWGATIDARLTMLETGRDFHETQHLHDDGSVRSSLSRIEDRISQISGRLDEVFQRGG